MTDKSNGYVDEQGNDWTLADLIADLEVGGNLYLTPKMCADLAQHLRQCDGRLQITAEKAQRAAAIRDEAKLYVGDQGRYCATINQNDYEWLLSLAENK